MELNHENPTAPPHIPTQLYLLGTRRHPLLFNNYHNFYCKLHSLRLKQPYRLRHRQQSPFYTLLVSHKLLFSLLSHRLIFTRKRKHKGEKTAMKTKTVTLTLLTLIILALATESAAAQTYVPPAAEIYTVSYPTFIVYAPVSIVVTYVSSPTYSLPEVSSFGNTPHEEHHTSDPQRGTDTLQFNTTAIDTYNITFTVHYDVWVNQTVLVQITEQGEGGRTNIMCLDMNTKGFTINMLISTQKAPSYPDPNEIIAGINQGTQSYWNNQIAQLQSDNSDLLGISAGTQILTLVAIFISITISMLTLIVLVRSRNRHQGGR